MVNKKKKLKDFPVKHIEDPDTNVLDTEEADPDQTQGSNKDEPESIDDNPPPTKPEKSSHK